MVIKPKNNLAPEAKDFGEYEKVSTDDFICGTISEVKYDPEYENTYNGEKKVYEAVKIVFRLDGYDMPHSTFWMKLSYHERSKVYKLFLKTLVEGAEPFMDFDLSLLEGMRVKTMWETNDKGYQNVVMVKPEGEKISSWS
jgi:predicted PolB exonuclease-like 3'-5' exonuclease